MTTWVVLFVARVLKPILDAIARMLVRAYWLKNWSLPKGTVAWAMRRVGSDYIRKMSIPFAGAVADGMANWPDDGRWL